MTLEGRAMQRQIIHITTFDEPVSIQVRRVGVVNFGLYCRCGEFIAFSVSEPRQPPLNVEFAAEHPVLVRCPFCQTEERRQVHQIMRVRLTEANRRRHDRGIREATTTQART
jgi:hypothetical protein